MQVVREQVVFCLEAEIVPVRIGEQHRQEKHELSWIYQLNFAIFEAFRDEIYASSWFYRFYKRSIFDR